MVVVAIFPMGGCSDSGSEAPPVQTKVFELSIQDREVAIDGAVIRITQGERVELHWTTDEATSIHLHGYDIEAGLEPGTTRVLSFDAQAAGRFPVTAHGFGPAADDEGSQEHGSHDHSSGQAQRKETTLLYLEIHPR